MTTGLNVPAGYACACLSLITRYEFFKKIRKVLTVTGLVVYSASAFAQIDGRVYRDFDQNGQQSATGPTEVGVAGVLVTAYVDGTTQPLTTTTATDGSFAFTSGEIAPGKHVRIEFQTNGLYTYDSPGATDGGSVQFVQAPFSVGYGISDPAEYCQATPLLVTPVYQTGAGSAAGTLLSFPFTAEGQPTTAAEHPVPLGTSVQLGTVWATAWQRQSRQLVSLSFLKRHAALGPLGLGGIYLTNPATAASTPYVDASEYVTLASPENLTTLSARTLPQSVSTVSVDGAVFGLVGKVGFGGATFTPLEEQLWVVNLHEKTLVSINVGAPMRPASQLTPDAFTSYTIPQSFTTGISRPWAVAYYRGKLYVGVVNDASITGDRADLRACVYAFDLATNAFASMPVLNVPLNYRKGWAVTGSDGASLGDHWESWSDTWTDFSTNSLNAGTLPPLNRVVRPQPILSSIAFDAEGTMLIGLMDRTGHQTSRNQPAPTETASGSAISTLYSGYTGGDILRASLVNDTYLLEGNGSSGANSGCGIGNGQGPADDTGAGGEFYCLDKYSTLNEETFTGSLMINPSLGHLVTTLFNPLTTWSGGTAFFEVQTGDLLRRYEVYRDGATGPVTAPRATFGAANGVGQVNAICEAAPIKIGNRVWVDTNGDGVQGPAEPPLPGVALSMYTEGGKWLASTTTNEKGQYSFVTGPSLSLAHNVPYYIVVGTQKGDQQFNKANQKLVVGNRGFHLTSWNRGMGAGPDRNDSDAFLLAGSATPLEGLPVVQFQVGLPGQTLNALDIGVEETELCNPPTCLQVSARRIR